MSSTIAKDLHDLLISLNGKGYKSYKTLQEKSFQYPPFTLCFEHVQGDPFAAPSRISLSTKLSKIGFSPTIFDNAVKKLALEDHLLRVIHKKISTLKGRVTGSGRSVEIAVQSPSQKVILRSGIKIKNDSMTVILFAGLPGNGRNVLAQECVRLFSELLPSVWEKTLSANSLELKEIQNSIKTLEDYFALRDTPCKNGWVAFVADGSHLPRE